MRIPITAAIVLMTLAPAAAQPLAPNEPTLTTRGQGQARVAPNRADLTVEVVTKGASASAATAAHKERASRAAAALRGMKNDGLEIESSVFHLNEIRTPPLPPANQGAIKPEYQAVTTFQLKSTQVAKVDGSVTALAATGLFEVRNLHFGIGDKTPGMNEARKNAVDDARERATTYAQAAGVRLGDIVRIDDGDARTPREFAVAAPMARSAQIIPPETLTLTASVTITWRIGRSP